MVLSLDLNITNYEEIIKHLRSIDGLVSKFRDLFLKIDSTDELELLTDQSLFKNKVESLNIFSRTLFYK